VLRAKGILPPKETLEVTEQDLINMVEAAIEQKSRGNYWSYMQVSLRLWEMCRSHKVCNCQVFHDCCSYEHSIFICPRKLKCELVLFFLNFQLEVLICYLDSFIIVSLNQKARL
jgi:hypothetical protein